MMYSFIQRFFDKRNLANIDHIVTNSYNVQNRIKKYFNKKSLVIYPGIETIPYQIQ